MKQKVIKLKLKIYKIYYKKSNYKLILLIHNIKIKVKYFNN
jgi:hypothetical protein